MENIDLTGHEDYFNSSKGVRLNAEEVLSAIQLYLGLEKGIKVETKGLFYMAQEDIVVTLY